MRQKVNERTWLKIARQDALQDQRGRCLYCHEPLKIRAATAEHRKARSKGGNDNKENIGATCQPCNSLKGSRTEKAFLRLLKSPPAGSPIALWLAWSRRRINLATLRACRNIARAVGLPDDDYKL